MKDFKRILFVFLVGMLSFLGICTNVMADAPKTFKTKDPVELTDYIVGAPRVHYKALESGVLVYCQNEPLVYQGGYTMKVNSQVDDGFIYILENKPNTGDEYKDYYAMQIAIWWYEDILNNNNVNISYDVKVNILQKVNTDKLVRIIYNLVMGAKNYTQNKEFSVEIDNNNTKFNIDGKYYVSEDITVKFVGDSADIIVKDAPVGVQIINKNVKDNTVTFNVKVPVSSLEKGKTTSFKVIAQSNGVIKKVYNYFFNNEFQKVIYGEVFKENKKVEVEKTLSITVEPEKEYEVNISKTDITGQKEIAGAKLNVKGDHNTDITWISTTESHKITLKPGVYTLTEIIAPKGYILSKESITFKLDENGKLYEKNSNGEYELVTKINMVNEAIPEPTPEVKEYEVNISKTDITGGVEIAGATLNVKGDNNTDITWVSTTESHKITLKPGVYTLTETIAPKGYILSKESIEFKLDENGSLYEKNSNGEYEKVTKINMINEVRPSINISKLNSKTNEYVSGATLNIMNIKGESVATFVTTNESYYVSLEEGEYVLNETVAPSGFILNKNGIYFKVDADGNLFIKNANGEYEKANGIILYNEPAAVVIPDVPKTGLSSTLTYVIGTIILASGAIVLFRNEKKC